MKGKRLFWAILFVLIFSFYGYGEGITIKGRVIDISTNEPLRGVYVTTGSKGGQTNAQGEYLIEGLHAGNIVLQTMYYSTYPQVNKSFFLQSDTTVNFELSYQTLNLDELVVTGTRTPRRLADSPILTTLIRDNEIRKTGAVDALESLIDHIPGIVVSPNAMGNNLRIKGLNTRYILFLVDGERMVSEGAGGNINLDQIDVNTIKRIEVINGAASALYGSNAVGAVINIITKEPIHKFEGGAQVIGQSNNTWSQRAYIGSNLKKVSTNLSGFRKTSDGFGGDGNGPYAAKYSDWGGTVKVGYTPNERLDLNAHGRLFLHETFNLQNSMNVVHPLTNSMALGLNGTWTSLNDLNKLKWSVNWDSFLDYSVFEKQNNKREKKNSADYISARIVDTYVPSNKWEIVGGVEYNYEKNYSTKTLGAEPTSKNLNDYNVFGQVDYEPFTNLNIIAGARYTYNTQFKSAFTPKLSLLYKIGGFNFRAGVGTAFRAPSIKELYYDFDHSGMFWIFGNPDLEAEKGLYNSLSVEYTRGLFNASLSGYYNDIDNKITLYDVINEMGAQEKYYHNINSATLKGIDFNVSYVLFRELTLRAAYSFCDAKDNATGLQLSSNVRHSSTVSTTWNGAIARSPFSLQLSGRVHSPILYQQKVEDKSGETKIYKTESSTYSIWKITLVKPFRLYKHTLELTAKCDNLFNFQEASFINPGRQYMVGVRYSFK